MECRQVERRARRTSAIAEPDGRSASTSDGALTRRLTPTPVGGDGPELYDKRGLGLTSDLERAGGKVATGVDGLSETGNDYVCFTFG